VAAGVSVAAAARPGAPAHAFDTRAHRALLDLYALDSRLHAARARAAALEARAETLRREESLLTQQLTATRSTLVVSQHQLAQNLSLLYKEGDVNALAIVLGADSLDEALTRLDDLNRVADQSERVVAVTTNAEHRLGRLRAAISRQRAALDAAVGDARRTEAALASARAERISFIASLRRAQRLAAEQIHRLQAAAERVVRKSDAIQAAAPPVEAPATVSAVGPGSARTITVISTGYSLAGRTATGMPVGWGVAAVDASVIPLGTRLTIPGYGEAVAADTGGAVRGNTIDLWFPTLAQARAWGRRTITITLH
jgi:3D (Asp-Asp-Asp) domain-containing protein